MKGLKRVEDMLDTFLKNEHLSKEARFCYEACMVKVQDEIAEEKKEPSLAELADEKMGYSVVHHRTGDNYYVSLNGTIDFQGKTIAEAEAKAIEYLGGL